MIIRPFNVNDYVRVKLSPASLGLWRANAIRMREAYPRLAGAFPCEPPVDADGFYRGQLWAIMGMVGPECTGGGQPFEDGCIHLEFKE